MNLLSRCLRYDIRWVGSDREAVVVSVNVTAGRKNTTLQYVEQLACETDTWDTVSFHDNRCKLQKQNKQKYNMPLHVSTKAVCGQKKG